MMNDHNHINQSLSGEAMDIAVQATDLSRDYGSFRALNKINIAIEAGRVVALLGPNGAGKTTFLHLLMGMLEPTEGTAQVLGACSRDVRGKHSTAIGYMGDSDAPPSWSTAQQLIELERDASPQFDIAFIDKFLFDKKIITNKAFGSLSKGQKKWLRAGLILASRPQLLLLDEPAEGLDPNARQDLFDNLREYINETEATALVATHIIGDIERIADDVAIIHQGRIRAYANLEDLRDQVREVHLPEGISPPPNKTITILGSKPVDEGKLYWICCHDLDDEALTQTLGPAASIHHVDLQTFYRAITENNDSQHKEFTL